MNGERYSVKVLQDCIDLQIQKGNDYQNAISTVKQADYYRLGLNTIYDIMHAKMLRMRSLLETAEHNENAKVNFESISDSAKDLINYASFFASYAEGKMDGQNSNNDIFNRPKKPVYTFPDEPVLPPMVKAVVEALDENAFPLVAIQPYTEDVRDLVAETVKAIDDDLGKSYSPNRILDNSEEYWSSLPVINSDFITSYNRNRDPKDWVTPDNIEEVKASIWPEITEEEETGDWSKHHESRW